MSSDYFGKLSAMFLSISTLCPSPPAPSTPSKGGRPARLPVSKLVSALAWHVLQGCGTFSKNTAMLLGMRMADASLSQRRTSLGSGPWTQALEAFLAGSTEADNVPEVSYRGLRLVGVDGTTFNVANTPTVKATAVKTKTRRGEAAFYRISCVAMAALGSHRPLAVRIGEEGESEGALAESILHALGEDDLLIADRYYGSGKWMARLEALPSKPLFLLRVQERFGGQRLKTLSDGSRLVHVKDPDHKSLILVREIKAKVKRPGSRWTKVRFWTNLLDEKRFPAMELVALYARRWEQEIAFRELKEHLHSNILLKSHTIPTAVQEICALFMAQAIVVSARMEAAASQDVPILQISFEKVLVACRHLCWLWAIAGDEIKPDIRARIAKKAMQEIAWQATSPRRKRTCPRKVRQPVRKWPRLFKNTYGKGDILCRIRKS
jgi:hypothetical protein